ncbi:hypothetical protein RF11_03226 [Thelohanellus kitauei]|uniref:Uncharacterized protein n=1 Tax=Thelohanellus kitauei TaxID=669202 RepID=A0A0C2MB26_THEKT|nr:hypothetical protein RF11_03226 [Thelohanellus kitauei]
MLSQNEPFRGSSMPDCRLAREHRSRIITMGIPEPWKEDHKTLKIRRDVARHHTTRKTNITLVPTTIPNEQTTRNTPGIITDIQRVENVRLTFLVDFYSSQSSLERFSHVSIRFHDSTDPNVP